MTLRQPATRSPKRAILLALVLAAALYGLVAATAARPAHASTDQASIMMGDDQLVYRNDATREAALKVMQALGADYVRVTVLWSNLALGIKQYDHKHHIRFRPANPAAYPAANWNRYDALVRSVEA